MTKAIDDPYTYKSVGSMFHIDRVYDILQYHGYWKDDGSIAVDAEYDNYKIVE